MDFNFDWNIVPAGAPYITISSSGLAFNYPSIKLLGNPEEVVVGFDERHMIIGVKDAKNMENAKAYKFASRVRSGWIRIGCKDFVKYLESISGVSFSPARKYSAKLDGATETLYIAVAKKGGYEDSSEIK